MQEEVDAVVESKKNASCSSLFFFNYELGCDLLALEVL
jgi:hypothetical protein